MILERNSKLIFETVTPIRVLCQELHCVIETALQKVLGHLKALELVHGLHLLLTLGPGNVQSLIFLLNTGNFSFDLLYPLIMGLLLAFVVL